MVPNNRKPPVGAPPTARAISFVDETFTQNAARFNARPVESNVRSEPGIAQHQNPSKPQRPRNSGKTKIPMSGRFRQKKLPTNHSFSAGSQLIGTEIAYLSPSSPESEGSIPAASCVRCRRLKKKCDRKVPECAGCSSSSEFCIYVAREKKLSRLQKQPTSSVMTPPSNSIRTDATTSAPNSPRQLIPVLATKLTERPTINEHLTGAVYQRMQAAQQRPPPQAVNGRVLLSKVDFKISALNNSLTRHSLLESLNNPKSRNFVEAYFKHIHRAYPFIDESEFMKNFEKIDFRNLSIYSRSFKFMVFMVMTVGCTALERANILNNKNDNSKDCRFSEVLFDVSLTFIDNDCSGSDFTTITQLLLLGLYAYYDPTDFSSWEITGKLVRQAISLGLNKKLTPKEDKTMTPTQVELRNRHFWSVYIMDRLVSVSLGRPVGIRDQDISTPLPSRLPGETTSIDTTNSVIQLRKLEGVILGRVHSISAEMSSPEDKETELKKLKNEIDNWFNQAQGRLGPQRSSQKQFSFHGSLPWLNARYYHLLILLYVPSHLQPKPSSDSLKTLGTSCLEALSCTYNLFKKSMLPLNWITLYRFLTICTAILHCLCKWTIDFQDSSTEIHYCVEILRAFSSDWHVAKRCAEVFETIENKMLDISIGSANSRDLQMDTLLNELWGTSSSYHQILEDSTVDLVLDNSLFDGFADTIEPKI